MQLPEVSDLFIVVQMTNCMQCIYYVHEHSII